MTARVSVVIDTAGGIVVENEGCWTAVARLAFWGEAGDGVVIVHRGDQHVADLEAYRFPAGWRSAAIGRAVMPETAKRIARRALRQLP